MSDSSPKLQNLLALAGRLAIAALFLPSGIGKLADFTGTAGYVASAGLPLPQVAAAIALLIEIVGGVALVAGYATRTVAIVFAVYTVVASFFFHAWWALPQNQQLVVQLLFFKNVAVFGGLLTLAAWGPGGWSLDALRSHSAQRVRARQRA